MASFRSIAKKAGRFVTGKERDRPPESKFWDELGATGPDDPNLLDPYTGMPRRQPAQEIAPAVQHAADIWTRRYKLNQQQAAQGTIANALEGIASSRPGGAMARQSGLYSQAAQTHLASAAQIESPYLLYKKDLEEQRLARKAQAKAGYAKIAGQVIGAAAGIGMAAATGGASIPIMAGLNLTGGESYFGPGGEAEDQTMNFMADTKAGYGGAPQPGGGVPQGGGGGGIGMGGMWSGMAAGGAAGGMVGRAAAGGAGAPMGAGLGGGPGAPAPGGGNRPAGAPPTGGAPQGGPGQPQGGPGQPPGQPGQPGQAGMQQQGMAPPTIIPAFPKTEAAFGIPSPTMTVAAWEIDPSLDPTPWLDGITTALDSMMAEDDIESPFTGMLA